MYNINCKDVIESNMEMQVLCFRVSELQDLSLISSSTWRIVQVFCRYSVESTRCFSFAKGI